MRLGYALSGEFTYKTSLDRCSRSVPITLPGIPGVPREALDEAGELLMAAMIERGALVQCPRCVDVTEFAGGCNHMT